MGTPRGSTVIAVVTMRNACLYSPYCSRSMRRTNNSGSAMLKAKPTVFAHVSHDTRHVRLARAVRVLLIAPSLNIIGGQSIQADRLLRCLANDPSVQVQFLPVNPRLPS